MKHRVLKCSLCCDKSFESKLDFAEHLAQVLANLACPVCDNKWASLAHLIEHLSIDDCQPAFSFDHYEEDKENTPIKNSILTEPVSEQVEEVQQVEENNENNIDLNDVDNEDNRSTDQVEITIAPSEESLTVADNIPGGSNTIPVSNSNMYIHLYDKDNETSIQGQTQKVKLVSEDGHIEQFVIMSTDNAEVKLENAILTKQNSDGTISLQSIKGECELLKSETHCIQGQTEELKLVSGDGNVEQFVIMSTKNAVKLENVENAVLTKQNSDGTISLQTVKELNQESETETVIAPSEVEAEDNQDELYSCNTCGVSFSSVFDHIQNYHNDQDVVVEQPLEDELNCQEDQLYKQEGTKRVITDTGDIVDAAIIDEPMAPDQDPLMTSEEVEKPTRQQGKRYVQIEKFCDSVVKKINPQDNFGPYHTVMLRDGVLNGNRVKTYYCMTCNIYAGNLDDFKPQPCKIPKYPCPHCPVAYENSKSLCAHMKVHKNKPDAEELIPNKAEYFVCEVCRTVFLTNKSLKLHKRMHDPVKSRPIEPPLETLDGSKGSTDRYKCEICDKLIPNDYKTIHQNSHKDNDQLNCGICNKMFHSNEYLEMHMSVHNVDKVAVNKTDKSLLYKCLYCERRFARPHEKVKHERIHTGEKPHSCEICGKSFRVAYCLTLHMRTHTGVRPYACPFCNKRFKAHSVYNHHLQTHSEVRRYKCPFCPKAFKTSVQLAGHKNSHTKPFSCQQCNRPFASLYAVRVHTETHARQNNLKFSCSLCGASYARAFALKDHMKQIHLSNVVSLAQDSIETAVKCDDLETEGEMSTIEDKELAEEITTELELESSDQL